MTEVLAPPGQRVGSAQEQLGRFVALFDNGKHARRRLARLRIDLDLDEGIEIADKFEELVIGRQHMLLGEEHLGYFRRGFLRSGNAAGQ